MLDTLGIDYVIENSSAYGVGYYRKWKSGFIEQWYWKQWNGAWSSLTYPVEFKDTDYHISGSGYRTDGSNWQGFCSFKDYTTTGCNIWFSDDNTSNPGYVKWYACGYYK